MCSCSFRKVVWLFKSQELQFTFKMNVMRLKTLNLKLECFCQSSVSKVSCSEPALLINWDVPNVPQAHELKHLQIHLHGNCQHPSADKRCVIQMKALGKTLFSDLMKDK